MDGSAPVTCLPPACHPCDMKPCADRGVCSENDTGFECTCKVGFSGETCAVDVCELDSCAHGACVRRSSGRTCKCEEGWKGEACDVNTNADLANLSVSAGAIFPPFRANVHEYSVDVGISAPEIAVIATAAVPGGVVTKIDGLTTKSGVGSSLYKIALNTSKQISIAVTADDGSQSIYVVTIRRSLKQRAHIERFAKGECFGGGCSELYFGKAVALCDGLLAVGTQAAARYSAANTGVLDLFSAPLGVWAEAKDRHWGPRAGASFGYSVAASKRWIAASAPDETLPSTALARSGAVYVYERAPGGLREPVQLVDPAPVDDGGFGLRVAMSDDTLVVLSLAKKSAYVFRYGDGWKAPPLVIHAPANTPGLFGPDVAIEGDLVAVGSADRDSNAGAVLVYDISGGTANQVGYLTHPSLGFWGTALGISEGRIVVAGGGSGAFVAAQLVVYERVGDGWMAGEPFGPDPDHAGGAFAMDGLVFQRNRILVSNREGGAHLFVEQANGWHEDEYLQPAGPGSMFGKGVAMDGDTIAVAAPGDGDESSGAVYVFGLDCENVPEGARVPGC